MQLLTISNNLIRETDIVDYTKEFTFTGTKEKKNLKSRYLNCAVYHLFNIAAACRAVKITEPTHYNWMKADPEYARAWGELKEAMIDFAESALYRKVAEGDTFAITWFLSKKAKHRGYADDPKYIQQTGVVINIE